MVDQEKIHNQCLSDDPKERIHALEELKIFFSSMPDKQQAWNDLLRLINDEDAVVMWSAAKALGSAFSQVLDKQQAWNDLHKLANDEDISVRWSAAKALGSAFSQVLDKQQAWNDLHRLTNDEDISVRFTATKALGSAFSQVPDKQQAWNELIRLSIDKDDEVRSSAAYAIGFAFAQVPDKQQAWNELIRLTIDEDSYVRSFSNHSLGRILIFMASQAETNEDYRKKLEKAIEFFETTAKEASYFNPAQFCLPFYRSFHTIIFKKQEAREEVNKYLEEAKAAIGGSESKKQLFEIIENLAKVLEKIQNLKNLNSEAKKNELKLCMTYCDRAEELIRDTEEKIPYAAKILRVGMPILKRNLDEIIKEIKENAKIAYKESIGTDKESLTFSICQEVHDWKTDGLDKTSTKIEKIIFSLKSKIPNIPENRLIYDNIESLKYELDSECQLELLSSLILSIPQQVTIINNIQDSEISIHSGTIESNKSFYKKIKHSIINSLGVASAAITLAYPVCEIYNIGNKNYICIGVFALFFFLSLPILYDN